MKTAFGGERLGSGNKMNVSMKNYSRSTHNLTESFRSSMAPGVLYPFYVVPATNGDTFDIDLTAMAKTLPTNGPLMGQFKLQLDMFLCPIRLYQGILHNNSLNIGLNMKDVKLPTMNLSHVFSAYDIEKFKESQVEPSTLIKYLGISGYATPQNKMSDNKYHAEREFNALPVLMYYDIFKNYYANKQEENAYVLTGETKQGADLGMARYWTASDTREISTYLNDTVYNETFTLYAQDETYFFVFLGKNNQYVKIEDFKFKIDGFTLKYEDFKEYLLQEYPYVTLKIDENYISRQGKGFSMTFEVSSDSDNVAVQFQKGDYIITDHVIMQSFPLDNIDKMRRDILSKNEISDKLVIDKTDAYLPYLTVVNRDTLGSTYNLYPCNGLCVKTYQSDIFNNWMNTEWIDGENGINAITTIDTTDGLKLDTLNLAQKVYNMLNRIATCGGTYQDWQKAVWSQNVIAHAESPIYCGGMSSEIVFEEIASSAATEEQPLGSLAGRGRLIDNKGGHLTIKVTEPSYIIGIVSITPRIDYFQGNAWHLTDIFTMDDFHKPELDGIGFQDLIGEQMAWWDSQLVKTDNTHQSLSRHAIGKLPAWLNYMTAVDKVYGDFAKSEGKNFMVLTRDYSAELNVSGYPEVTDFTTYIDPLKFNYAFTDASRTAQNFWVQILTHVTARRVMSAKIIPNL